MDKTLKVINELKRKGIIKDYAIGGAIATIHYTEPFSTYDLDIFITPPSRVKNAKEWQLSFMASVYKYLSYKGYIMSKDYFIIEGMPVEFLVPIDRIEEEAVKNAKRISYKDVKTKVITPEYLIALQLKTGRARDYAKMEKLLTQARVNMPKLKNILRRFGLSDKFNDVKRKWIKS